MRASTASGVLIGAQVALAVWACRLAFLADPTWLREPLGRLSEAGLLGLTLVTGGAIIGAVLGPMAWWLRPRESLGLRASARDPVSLEAACYSVGLVVLAVTTSVADTANMVWLQVAVLAAIMTVLARRWARGAEALDTRVGSVSLGIGVGGALYILGATATKGIATGWAHSALAVLLFAGAFGIGLLLVNLVRRGSRPGRARWTLAAMVLMLLLGSGAWTIGRLSLYRPYVQRAARAAQANRSTSPNLILISIDTLRGDYPGYTGGLARTPNLDALAAQSYAFSHAYTTAPWTTPAMAAALGGRYPSDMGVGLALTVGATMDPSWPWDDSRPTLPELLQHAGYTTSAVLTNGLLRPGSGAERGLDHLFHTNSIATGSSILDCANQMLQGALIPPIDAVERANRVTNWAQEAVTSLRSRPCFFWVHYMDPHYPYDAPDRPQQYRGDLAGGMAVNPAEREQIEHDYTAEVEFNDEWLGRLFETLKTQGLWNSSVIIVFADHGEEFWEHDGFFHGHSFYNELIHVPMLIHLPGQTAGQVIEQSVSLLDIMPTALELCKVAVPRSARGRSLTPLFQGRSDDLPPFELFLESTNDGTIRKALFTGRFKLIRDLRDDSFTLFDLAKDPEERNNIWAGAASRPEMAAMARRLTQWSDHSTEMMNARFRAETNNPDVRRATDTLDPITREHLRDLGYIGN